MKIIRRSQRKILTYFFLLPAVCSLKECWCYLSRIFLRAWTSGYEFLLRTNRFLVRVTGSVTICDNVTFNFALHFSNSDQYWIAGSGLSLLLASPSLTAKSSIVLTPRILCPKSVKSPLITHLLTGCRTDVNISKMKCRTCTPTGEMLM